VSQAEGALAQVQASIPVLEAGLDAAMNALDVMLGSGGCARSDQQPPGSLDHRESVVQRPRTYDVV